MILSIFVASNLFVLFKLKMKIDGWGYFTLALHFTVCILRLMTPSFKDSFSVEKGNKYYELSYGAEILIWVSIYNFTFELLNVRITLLNEESEKKKKIILIMKCITISVMATLGVFVVICNIQKVKAIE